MSGNVFAVQSLINARAGNTWLPGKCGAATDTSYWCLENRLLSYPDGALSATGRSCGKWVSSSQCSIGISRTGSNPVRATPSTWRDGSCQTKRVQRIRCFVGSSSAARIPTRHELCFPASRCSCSNPNIGHVRGGIRHCWCRRSVRLLCAKHSRSTSLASVAGASTQQAPRSRSLAEISQFGGPRFKATIQKLLQHTEPSNLNVRSYDNACEDLARDFLINGVALSEEETSQLDLDLPRANPSLLGRELRLMEVVNELLVGAKQSEYVTNLQNQRTKSQTAAEDDNLTAG